MPDLTAAADVHDEQLACVEEVKRQAKDMYDIDPQAVVFKRVTEDQTNVGRCQVEYAVRVGEGEGARLMSCDAAWREDGEEEGEEEGDEGEEEGEEKPLCFFLDSRLVSDMDNVHKLLHGRYAKCPSSSSKEESCDCAVDLIMKRLRAMKASALGKRAGARFLRQWESRMRKGAVEMQRKEARRLQEEGERKLRQQEEERRRRWEEEEQERRRRWQQEEEERQARMEQDRREEEERRREKEEEWRRQLEERVRQQKEEDERRRMQRQEEEDRRRQDEETRMLQQLEKEKEEERSRRQQQQQQQAVAGIGAASATEDRPEASSVTEEPAQGPFKGGHESPRQQPCGTEEGERQPLSADEGGPKDVHEEDDDDDSHHGGGAFFGGGGDDSSVEGGPDDRAEGPSLMDVDEEPMRTEGKAQGGEEDLTQVEAQQPIVGQERQTEASQVEGGTGAEQPVQPPEQREAHGRGWLAPWGGQRGEGAAQGGGGGGQGQPPLSAPLPLSPVRRWWVDEADDHDDDTPTSAADPTYRSPYSYTPKKPRLRDARAKRLPAMSRELVALQKDQISRLNAQLARLQGKVQHLEQHKQQQEEEEEEDTEEDEEEDGEEERRKGELEGKLTGLERDLEGEQARVKALKAKLTAKEEEMKRLKEVEEEVREADGG
jgi:hypothetical protein